MARYGGRPRYPGMSARVKGIPSSVTRSWATTGCRQTLLCNAARGYSIGQLGPIGVEAGHIRWPYNGGSRELIVDTEKILVVDDEEAIREVVSTLLEAQGYHCTDVLERRTGPGRLSQGLRFDLVLSDIVMPEMDGLKLLAELRMDDPDVPVIMVTAMHDISIALEAIRAGAYDYILKPFEKDQLYLSVRRALEHRRLVIENRTYQSDSGTVWSPSARSSFPSRCRIWSSPTTTRWKHWAARWTRKTPKQKATASA